MADGSVDIVIGTHRLLQTAVRWKDLGLVVVDEEQRFGVEHKEHLKSAAHPRRRADDERHPDPAHPGDEPGRHPGDVDDPDPARGALPGADLRRPARRQAGRRGAAPRTAARRAGVLRAQPGQHASTRAAARVRALVPEARVAVAHGQMPEEQLERTVEGFWNREYDILVCTTIVETGLDISNANTLIVERADTFGLSQLHQLRGRVGRSRERGYAYFLYPQRDAAHRDRLRPAGHHRPEQRTRRGHGSCDEGPGDPRRRQRARRASSPVTSPGWASTCTCGWWARRSRPTGPRPTARR